MAKKSKCAECHWYEERAAIMEYLAGFQRREAERRARNNVCYGCDGERGVDLFENIEQLKND